MKKALLLLVCFVLLTGIAVAAGGAKTPYNIQVDKLYSAPDDSSKMVYEIPLEVRLLDMSADNNWYKVKISFNIGPFNYTYVGWAEIPVGDMMAEREKAAKLAKAPPAETPQEEAAEE